MTSRPSEKVLRDYLCSALQETRRSRLAVALANWILRTWAPGHAMFIRGAIEYGMSSAARDALEGRDSPPNWREVRVPE